MAKRFPEETPHWLRERPWWEEVPPPGGGWAAAGFSARGDAAVAGEGAGVTGKSES